MNGLEATLARACECVPDLVRGALVLLPEGYLIGGTAGTSALDFEPLIRATTRCTAASPPPTLGERAPGELAEFLFVVSDQYVVIERGRRDRRVALALVTGRECNLAFVLVGARQALSELERDLDLEAWGL